MPRTALHRSACWCRILSYQHCYECYYTITCCFHTFAFNRSTLCQTNPSNSIGRVWNISLQGIHLWDIDYQVQATVNGQESRQQAEDTSARHLGAWHFGTGPAPKCLTPKRPVTVIWLVRPKLHYTDTGSDRLRTCWYDTTNGQAHNNSTTCCTTNSPPRTDKNLPHRNARAQRIDMSRCWDVANFCPLVVNLLYNKL